MAQVNVGGDNGIYCWNLDTGAVVYSITGAFPWTGISQRGLAYRPDDNSFYIGGWNEGIVYHVRGRGAGQGEVIGSCNPSDGNISGLAWNPAFNILWAATNSPTDTIYQLNPSTCSVLSTLPHPSPGFGGAGLEMDEEGNLWMIDQSPNNVYLIESGVPAFSDVPWLSETPSSGTLPSGRHAEHRRDGQHDRHVARRVQRDPVHPVEQRSPADAPGPGQPDRAGLPAGRERGWRCVHGRRRGRPVGGRPGVRRRELGVHGGANRTPTRRSRRSAAPLTIRSTRTTAVVRWGSTGSTVFRTACTRST